MTVKSPGSAAGKKLRHRIKRLKWQLWTLFLAWKDPQTPMRARIIIAVAVAYAVSPIDLIPDIIPIVGQLDDLLLLPLLVGLAIRLIPRSIFIKWLRPAWQKYRSGNRIQTKAGKFAAAAIMIVWIVAAITLLLLLRSALALPDQA